jgi:DNA-binding XRE family transcriptional regulator
MEYYNHHYLQRIGKIIKAKRKLTGIKEDTLAKAVCVSQPLISQIEKGKYDCVKATLLMDICTHLQIPMNELFSPPKKCN